MPHDHHDHDHDYGLSPSGHPYRADDDVPLTYWQTMEIAVRELLVEKGIRSTIWMPAALLLAHLWSHVHGLIPHSGIDC
jgi:hypothetical protein